ncbi:MAG TPA: hypothetical protein VGV09_18555 [Steroidobacteraceae bacterium]|nr:hypothetical protein [Steroidobacteraceae bacterium]
MPKGTSDRKSAVLTARAMGFLAIRLQFHGAPVSGLKVTFCRVTDIDDGSPEDMDPVRLSADDGLAFFPRLVPAGYYGVKIEHQPLTHVPTVASLDHPCPVILPVDRPFVDSGDFEEFVFRP